MAIEIGETKRASANPTKEFFVKMITRDISLEDCILDLIDNSVDGAWRCEGSRPIGLAETVDLSKYAITITALPDRFSIEDNCGGMSLDDAINHAFCFGRRETDDHDNYSIGVYGIGMKRAVFKLGTDIRIRSRFTDADGKRESFAVPILVNEWIRNDKLPWDFDIVPDEGLPANGVEIVVGSLTPGTSASFGSPAFLQNLRRTISRDYSVHMSRGLRILLNDTPVLGWEIELRQSDDFVPLRVEYKDEVDGEEVLVEIIGGMAAPPPETNDPADEDDSEKRFGWYVICNGRIVLAADKTTVSGWGSDNWPQWHGQYSGFIGIILFSAANATALPLTTTKRSVDASSEVYRRARPRMREVTRAWIDYTNARKQAITDAKVMEEKATFVSIRSVLPNVAVKLPVLIPRATEPVANVHYSVPMAKLKLLAKELGRTNMAYRDVGLKSFEYTYNDLVGRD